MMPKQILFAMITLHRTVHAAALLSTLTPFTCPRFLLKRTLLLFVTAANLFMKKSHYNCPE